MRPRTVMKNHSLNVSKHLLTTILIVMLCVAHAAAGQMIQTHPSHVVSYGMFNACAWSSDGAKIALAHSNAVSLLDAQNLQRLDTFFTTHCGSSGRLLNLADISSIAFSEDGQRLAVACSAVTVFSTDGKVIFTIEAGGRHSVAFSHNGQYLATGAGEGNVDLWNAATGEHVRTLTGHTHLVFCLAFSPDDSKLITGGDDNKAILWDVTSGQTLRTLTDHPDGVFFAGFMPDGTTPITASYDDTIRRWDPAGAVTFQIPNYVESLAVSAKYIAAYTSMGSILIWDTASMNYVGELVPNTGDDYASSGTPRQVAFSPDGTRLISGSARSKCVRLWDTTQWSKTLVLAGHAYSVNTTAFSPDGKYVLTGSDDYTAKLWDAGTGDLVRTFTGHGHLVHSVAFSKDGTRAVTGCQDGTAKVWNTATGQSTFTFSHSSSKVNAVVFSPDGSKALSGSNDGTAKLWGVSTGTVAQTYTTPEKYAVTGVAFSPDGNSVLLAVGNTAKTYNTATGAVQVTFGDTFSGTVTSVAFSPDGTKVLIGYKYASQQAPGKMAKVWDAASGTLLQTLTGYTQDVNCVAFSPDGTRALTGASASSSGGVSYHATLWDVQTGQALGKLGGHTNAINGVAFSPDGLKAVTASSDRTARITALNPALPLSSLNLGLRAGWPPVDVVAALSSDGSKVLTSSDDYTALLWDATSRAILQTFTGHKGYVTKVAFSPDGAKVMTASADKTAIIWDVATGQALQTLKSHADAISAVSFSHDGAKALTASRDGTAILWDVADGSPIRTFSRPQSIFHFFSAAFSPDDKRILTGVDGNDAVLWDVATGSEIIFIRGREAVAFSPDGSQLLATQAATTLSNAAAVWDATTAAQIRTFVNIPGTPPPATDYMLSAAFSRDGTKVITGSSNDATTRVWDVATGRELTRFMGCGASTISTSPDGVHILTGDPHFGATVVMWAMDPAARPSAQPIAMNTAIASAMAPNAYRDFALDVGSGDVTNLVVRLRHGTTSTGTWSLVGAADYLPTLEKHDWYGLFTESGNGWERLEMPVPASAAGTYHFSVYYANALGGEPVSLNIECVPVQKYVVGLSATSGSNNGSAAVRLFGLGFQEGLSVQLLDGDNNVVRTFTPAAWDAVSLALSMDLTGLAGGAYRVAVVWSDATLTLKQPFTVQPGIIGPRLEAHIEVPPLVRYDRPSTLWLDYANTGDEDMPAPLLIVSIKDQPAVMRLQSTLQWEAPTIQVVGVNPQGDAGILPAGGHHRIPIYFTSYGEAHSTSHFTLGQFVADETPVDWEQIGIDMRPPGFSDEAWDAVWTKFSAKAGSTWASLLNLVNGDATWLAQHGRPTNDLTEILRYELSDADARRGGDHILTRTVDAYCPAWYLPLAFERIGSVAVDQRLRAGPLGRVWSHSFEYKVEFPSQYLAAIVGPHGTVRRFEQRRYAGLWESDLGDNGQFEGSHGNPCKLTEANGAWATFDAQGKLTEIRESNGDRVTLSYDANQNLTRVAHSNGGTFTLSYNGQGRIETLTDQAGQITAYAYDASGEHLISATAPGGIITTYGYETAAEPAEHALTSVTYPDGTRRVFAYDEHGRLSSVTHDGDAETLDVAYDGLAGETVTDATGAAWRYFYAPAGDLLWLQDPLDNLSQMTYDGGHNLTRLVLPDGAVHELRYNERNHAVEWLNPNLDSVKLGYTRILISPGLFPDRFASITDPNGNESTFDYNTLANVTTIAYPDDSAAEFKYNANGSRIQSFTNRRQQTITYTFNARGQVTGKSYPDGSSASYVYDDAGRLTAATNAAGTIAMTCDSRGYMASIHYPSGHGYTFQYNNAGQRTQRVADDGYTLHYAYDAAGHLAALSDGAGKQLVQYLYDAAGQLAQETRANGSYTTYAYDAAGRIANITHYAPGGAVESYFSYTYDLNGNPISMATPDGTAAYSYDFAGQLISADLPNGEFRDYQYDAAGNRTLVNDNGFPAAYSANALNQYVQVGACGYVYDADGNQVSRQDPAATRTCQYDEENRLVRILSGGSTWEYTYDALGNRTTVTHNGTTTRYVHDPFGTWNVAAEYDGNGSLTARYAYGIGLAAQQAANGQCAYYAFDAAGNTRLISDAAGSVVDKYDYDPFGNVLAKTESLANSYRFAGRFGVSEDSSGLLFMKRRYYEAAAGRFLSPDPLGYAPGANLYTYALNNPLRYADPEGEAPRVDVTKAPPERRTEVDRYSDDATLEDMMGSRTQRRQQFEDKLAQERQCKEQAEKAAKEWEDKLAHQQTLDLSRCEFDDTSRGYKGTLLLGGGSSLMSCPFRVPQPEFKLDDENMQTVQSLDPNEKVSPRGGGLESERIVALDEPIPYTVYFENQASASAPAQTVVVSDTLDASLDKASLVLTSITWGDHQVAVPSGNLPFHTRESVSDYRNTVSKIWWVDVDVTLDGSGNFQCSFATIDPDTGLPPEDPVAGFLPPNDATHRGEGSVMFSVKPKADTPLGTRIVNKASIVFDTNTAIETNEVFNTVGVLYKLTLNANAAQGTLAAAEDKPYSAGTVVHLTATPLAGYRVLQWSGTDDDTLTGTTNTVTMTDNKVVSVTFAEVPRVGSLCVTIEPEDARNAGAQWHLDAGAWQNSGVTLSGVSAGTHIVEFKEIPPQESSGCFGSRKKPWTTPASQTISIAADQTTAITGSYTLSEKSLDARVAGNGFGGDLWLFGFAAAGLLASRRRERVGGRSNR